MVFGTYTRTFSITKEAMILSSKTLLIFLTTGLSLTLCFNAQALAAQERLNIAVAANFKPTLEKINKDFESQMGVHLALSSASTGVLATQILNGAPFDIFFSADDTTTKTLAAKFSAHSQMTKCYAIGRLALVGAGHTLEALKDPRLSVAIANPATAPYGRAGLEVLNRQAHSSNERKVVRGNNAAQAYQFWHSGAVDLAIVPLSLAGAKGIPIPSAWHSRLEQHLLITKPSPLARRYLNWVISDTVRASIKEAGYELCP